MAKIGVVTVTYNSSKVLADFMESVLKQDHEDFILYVVDNDSKDDTLCILANYPDSRVKLIANKENYGVAKGNNQGILAAIEDECDYIMLLNNDTVFNETLFSILYDTLVESNVDMVTPKIMYYDPQNMIWAAGGGFKKWWSSTINYHLGDKKIDSGQYNFIMRCDYAPTCCILFRTILFDKNSVGLFDEKYFVYFDDTDWMWRAKNLGKVLIYTPKETLYHKVSALTGGDLSEFSIKMCLRNGIYFRRKNLKSLYKAYSIGCFIFFNLFKLFIKRLPRKYTYTVMKALKNGFFM